MRRSSHGYGRGGGDQRQSGWDQRPSTWDGLGLGGLCGVCANFCQAGQGGHGGTIANVLGSAKMEKMKFCKKFSQRRTAPLNLGLRGMRVCGVCGVCGGWRKCGKSLPHVLAYTACPSLHCIAFFVRLGGHAPSDVYSTCLVRHFVCLFEYVCVCKSVCLCMYY